MEPEEFGNEIVVVTGSSGCLGQHIVKLLHISDKAVNEIRLFDVTPFRTYLDYNEMKRVRGITGDIRNPDDLKSAFAGASCVIHAAAIVDCGLNPNYAEIESVNVNGTSEVITACINQNVEKLIYASTTTIFAGKERIFYGRNNVPFMPSVFLMGPYAASKEKAEDLVLQANGRLLANGLTTLKTVSIRSPPFYGEQDKNFIYHVVKFAQYHFNFFPKIDCALEDFQICYVGNAAWAHLKAKDALSVNEDVPGESFIITDDSQGFDINEQFRPFLEAGGITLSPFYFPYWVLWIWLTFLSFIISIISCFRETSFEVPSVNQLRYLSSTYAFDRRASTVLLEYFPVYTTEVAKRKSKKYYAMLKL